MVWRVSGFTGPCILLGRQGRDFWTHGDYTESIPEVEQRTVQPTGLRLAWLRLALGKSGSRFGECRLSLTIPKGPRTQIEGMYPKP